MMSWVLVNRFRVRREVLMVTVLELIDAPSSSDEKLVDEDVRERAVGRFILQVGTRQIEKLSHGCIYTTTNRSLIKFMTVHTTTRQIHHVLVASHMIA